MSPRICFNAIVRNEAANIGRLLRSVCPHVDAVIIADTGSSDNTIDMIKEVCAAEGVPCEVHHTGFHDFSQARNFALDRAYESPLEFEYILLGDADMELVDGQMLHKRFTGGHPAFYMLQYAGGLAYHNVRLVARDLGAHYIGVTHEYIDIGNNVPLMFDDAHWLDHATGSNRGDKFKRDIRLLLESMRTDKNNPRSWFYLANSYMEDGQHVKAINAFKKRIALGDWFEEVWHAQLGLARCYRALGKRELFVEAMLKAADMKPDRAEPLYDLAKFYRESGENRVSTIFSEAGLALPRPSPGNSLFIERWVYDWALEFEHAITAFYDPRTRVRGFTSCDHISLRASAPVDILLQARNNLYFYSPMLADIAPSWHEERLDADRAEDGVPIGHYCFMPPEGYVATNPSVTVRGNETYAVVRCVNYTITPAGQYDMHGDTAIRTRNFLVNLSKGMTTEIIMPFDWPKPVWDQVIGWEDMRLFVTKDGVFGVSATVRETNPDGWCEIWVAAIDENTGMLEFQKPVLPKHRQHEKNWAPIVTGNDVKWKYRPTMLINRSGVIEHTISDESIRLDDLAGGSQLVPYDGGWLAVVHEAGAQPNGQRWYRHRFIWYDCNLIPQRVSNPFCLHHKGIEFCAGLTLDPSTGGLMLSYGVKDREAWIGRISRQEVRELLWTKEHE